ncbi:MAG TPA: hypothetical protein VGH65_01615 [Verrucomicrobiaceae bacterium]
MLQAWNIKTRSHECARTGRPFVEGENFHAAIHFDTQSGEFVRRDICAEAWADENAERAPFSSWQSVFALAETAPPKPELTGRDSAENLLRKLCEEDEAHTENARYILALMLERKKLLVPKETREGEQGRMLIYEHRKTGEVFIIRDPELRLDEIEQVQEQVAMLLGFGGPAADAAAAVGMAITPEGKIETLGQA